MTETPDLVQKLVQYPRTGQTTKKELVALGFGKGKRIAADLLKLRIHIFRMRFNHGWVVWRLVFRW